MTFVTNLVNPIVDPKSFLNGLRPEDLYIAANFNKLKYSAFDFIENRDRDGAMEFSVKLERLVTAMHPTENREKQIYSLCLFWLLRLKMLAFSSLSLQDQVDIFKKYPAAIFENGFDLQKVIFKYIDTFSTGPIIEDIIANFLNALLNSSALIAKDPKIFERNAFKPTVGNFLKQYQYALNKKGVKDISPGAFDFINFIDTDPNVRLLLPEEKQILQSLLVLYNWLLKPIIYIEETQNKTYTNITKFRIPPTGPAETPRQAIVFNNLKPANNPQPNPAAKPPLQPSAPSVSPRPAGLNIDQKLEELKKRLRK